MSDISIATRLLLHLNGVDGATSLLDSSAYSRTLSSIGSAQLTTSNSRFGSASLSLNGSSGASVVIPPIGDLDFTFELWVYASSVPASWQAAFGLANSGSGPTFYISNPSGKPVFYHPVSGANISHQDSITPNAWNHLALVRLSGTTRIYLNGVESTASGTNNINFPHSRTTIGCSDTSGSEGFVGLIDEARIVYGPPVYTSAFSPPSSAFADPPPFSLAYSALTGPKVALAGNPKPTPNYKNFEAPKIVQFDRVFGGDGKIVGSVKEKATPTNQPLARKVRLFNEFSGKFIRETWSDAVTGSYAFTNIDRTQRYTVVTYDHVNNYRAVIADNLIPELM